MDLIKFGIACLVILAGLIGILCILIDRKMWKAYFNMMKST